MTFPIYLDEHIHLKLAQMLAEIGCDALTARDAGNANKGMSDEEQLQYAADNGRALVTFNGRVLPDRRALGHAGNTSLRCDCSSTE